MLVTTFNVVKRRVEGMAFCSSLEMVTTLHVVTVRNEAKGFLCWNNLVTTCNVVTSMNETVKEFIGPWALNMRPWAFLVYLTTYDVVTRNKGMASFWR